MTELIKGGPYIPGGLMNLLEEGQVVFFCGAGISLRTDLPTFPGLVQDVYRAFGTRPDTVELEALDLPQEVDWDSLDLDRFTPPPGIRHHPKYDKALELLERPTRHGRIRPDAPSPLRQAVISRLSKRVKGSLDVHRALLTLSKTTRGVRLVTTNFDTRFESAARTMKLGRDLFDTAPKLPVPKPHDWHTCVHLHGVIDKEERGDQLILTAADFGRAYLTDRWAARFVSELFRDFHVVFVGYGLGDPVMTYLVDALAAERTQGRPLRQAYAFVSHDGTKTGAENAERAWQAKNVEPILYANQHKHRLLNETLIEWARIREDPFEARRHIVLRGMEAFPDGLDGPVTRNVVWSLNSPVAAQALAEAPPIADVEMFPKLIAWLDILWEKGLFSRPVEGHHAKSDIFGGQSQIHGVTAVDSVGISLCRWISNHLHVPSVLEWLLNRGGYFHEHLRDEIRRKLADENITKHPQLRIDPRLRQMWTILVNQQPIDFRADLWLSQQFENADGMERELIVDAILKMIAPRLAVLPGPSSKLRLDRIYDPDAPDPEGIETSAHLEVFVGMQGHRELSESILSKPGVLGSRAFILTDYLREAVKLLHQTKEWRGDSSWERPSIADHRQNAHRDKWTKLISLVRDSYLQLAKKRRSEANALLEHWCSMECRLFHRLALHAITEDRDSDIGLIEPILLRGRKKGLWEDELRREVLRFLRKAGKRIPQKVQVRLSKAILDGPSYGGKGSEDWQIRLRTREIGLRLGKLRQSGATLSKAAEKAAIRLRREKETQNSHQEEFTAWIGEVTDGSAAWFDGPSPKLATSKMLSERIGNGELTHDDFETQLRLSILPGFFALYRLTRKESWPVDQWRQLVRQVSNSAPNDHKRATRCVLHALYEAPDELIETLGTSTANFLRDINQVVPIADENKLFRLWQGAWNAVGPTEHTGDWDRMTQALNEPAGKLAEIAASRLWMHSPEVNKGLPEPVRPYFESIGEKQEDVLARVILIRFLNNLYLIDPEWTNEILITPMKAVETEVGRDLWTAYGYSPHVSPNLLSAIKHPFFEVLKNYDDERRTDDNLVSMFMSVCLDLPNELNKTEISKVVQNLPEPALVHVAHFLERRLSVAKEDRGTAWREKVHPWLKRYWPTLSAKNTQQTSEALARMILETGDAFPEAVAWGETYLKSIEGHIYFGINRSSYPTTYPNDTLSLLEKIVPENGNIPWEKSYLKQALDSIKSADTDLGSRPTFLRLYRIAIS